MKQLIQDLKTGEVTLVELPVPSVGTGKLLIKVNKSLISLGTEKMMLDFGKGGWISKAKQQPDKVKMVLDKMKTDGLMPTVNTVLNKLGTPMPLGYSNVGEVIAVGKGVEGFEVGDRVISNGNHAEVVAIPANLCAKVPTNVSDGEACFTVVAAIALQGVRLSSPTLGETVVVVGLGLIGLITVQLLRANGCNVIGFDLDPEKVELAKTFGAKAFSASDPLEVEKIVMGATENIGADSVIITASTKSNAPIDTAPKICRHRGKVILVGVVGLELNRTEFFKKEISFQVSCSYGPGRYDNNYEQKGMDYPIGFVRWTENRNFKAVLNLLENKMLSFKALSSKEVNFSDAPALYDSLTEAKGLLGVLLNFPESIDTDLKNVKLNSSSTNSGNAVVGMIGAGGFTSGVLLPAFKKTNARLKSIASSAGLSGHNCAVKFNIENNTTDYNEILKDEEVNAVVISTPHNSHGRLVIDSLKAGKHVFVEKPLAISMEEVDQIEKFYQEEKSPPSLMVGFNRRFSPLSLKLKDKLSKSVGPKAIIYTVNSGFIPSDHWTQDPEVGGLRLVGEGCHFIDYIRYLVGSKIKSAQITFADVEKKDVFTVSLSFEDGSIGTVHYFSNGNKTFPKERVEVFCEGSIYTLDNYRKLEIINAKGQKSSHKIASQDKGHKDEIKNFVEYVSGSGKEPIPLEEIIEVSKVTLQLNT
jgi:predicted dehydrogenase/threonine dehydrogenase-like Zn-dependent dehydrogenase